MQICDLPAATVLSAADEFQTQNAYDTEQKISGTQLLAFVDAHLTVAPGKIASVSATAGIGYATGAGLAVTQITNRSTEVIIAAICGAITTDATSLAAGDEATFTVTNTAVAVGDVVVVSLRSGATANTSIPVVSAVAAGSFNIRLTNLSADTADTGASIINFAVIKAVGA
jgi:ABC-type uncharacterized transport system YnjBCD ATPase subunit